jgi:hypothetical protein
MIEAQRQSMVRVNVGQRGQLVGVANLALRTLAELLDLAFEPVHLALHLRTLDGVHVAGALQAGASQFKFSNCSL